MLIIIDCAPTESILTEAAYFASRYVIVPIKPEFMATIGLPLLARSVDEFKMENEDHEIDIAGLIINSQSEYVVTQEKNTAIREVTQIAREYGWHILEPHIRYSRSYPVAAREATPLASTSYVRQEPIDNFKELKMAIFDALGIMGKKS